MSDPSLVEVIKTVEQITSRLFNHRLFTTGEINYLINEFESNSHVDERINSLLDINKDINNASFQLSNDFNKLDLEIAKEIESRLCLCEEAANELISMEQIYRLKDSENLTEPRLKRDKLKSHMILEAKEKIGAVDASLKKEEESLEARYRQFEENLTKKVPNN